MPNRLVEATSPYLQQHADNPVDWWEWSEEAFAEARRRDVPVLLSVGYAACHWCHVMAHESFEDEATAEDMNRDFVNVKVDREERPDVDAVYMSAIQALTGQGGWPMTVFLLPDGRPFYAGTYFPARAVGQVPAFRQVLSAVTQTWTERREDVEESGGQIAEALQRSQLPESPDGTPLTPTATVLADAVRTLTRAEDRENGGFGGAPKFPPSMTLEFLLRHAASDAADGTGRVALDMASRTLRAMARSGMYDQVVGGFARYSVDRAWVVPHFEKMLYDNAQLARVYLHWWRATGEATGARIALETCDWMVAALGTAEGGLASSLDADTPDGDGHGVEGLTYAWTPAELVEALGEEDGAWVAQLLLVTEAGTFEHGASTAQLERDVWADPAEAERWVTVREELRRRRAARPQPGRDDKVVTAWNGLAIAALAETGALLDRPDLVEAATRAATLVTGVHLVEGPADARGGRRLRRASRDGRAGAPLGVLEDHGDLAEGLLTLHGVTGETRWLDLAGALLETVLTRFADAAGALHDTADDATDPELAAVRRPQDPTDNAYPSGTSAAAGALLSYSALTGSTRHREAAERALGPAAAFGPRAPQAFGWALAVGEAALDGPREVAVVGPVGDPLRERLHRTALAATAPGCVVVAGEPGSATVPLLADRPLVGGSAAAYVCRGFVCEMPVTDPVDLARRVTRSE